MRMIDVTYEKIYTDDSGKHTCDIFARYAPSNISYKRLWGGIVDGFFKCGNSDILITSTEGSIRIVIIVSEYDTRYKFEQYYLSGLDGKVVRIPKGVQYAIQNMEDTSSSFLIGSNTPDLDFEFSNSRVFNWRKKRP